MNWTTEKPTEPGKYLAACFAGGDWAAWLCYVVHDGTFLSPSVEIKEGPDWRFCRVEFPDDKPESNSAAILAIESRLSNLESALANWRPVVFENVR